MKIKDLIILISIFGFVNILMSIIVGNDAYNIEFALTVWFSQTSGMITYHLCRD